MKYITICLFIFISACTVTEDEINSANIFCKDNGGIARIIVDGGETSAVCKNKGRLLLE